MERQDLRAVSRRTEPTHAETACGRTGLFGVRCARERVQHERPVVAAGEAALVRVIRATPIQPARAI
jgi:hypothetical protein